MWSCTHFGPPVIVVIVYEGVHPESSPLLMLESSMGLDIGHI